MAERANEMLSLSKPVGGDLGVPATFLRHAVVFFMMFPSAS
jgi:hypothetical protein